MVELIVISRKLLLNLHNRSHFLKIDTSIKGKKGSFVLAYKLKLHTHTDEFGGRYSWKRFLLQTNM